MSELSHRPEPLDITSPRSEAAAASPRSEAGSGAGSQSPRPLQRQPSRISPPPAPIGPDPFQADPGGAWVDNEWRCPVQRVQFGERGLKYTVAEGSIDEAVMELQGCSGVVIPVYGVTADSTVLDLKLRALQQLLRAAEREDWQPGALDTVPLSLQYIFARDDGTYLSDQYPDGLEGTKLEGAFVRRLDDTDRLAQHGLPQGDVVKMDIYSRLEWEDFLQGRLRVDSDADDDDGEGSSPSCFGLASPNAETTPW
eukprot:TRINITY_DN43602_c0_g1_i1.p1 TRINITY_DN43602_c0_g1~~TRINITY_DN43602_c0_g1_i1.p1  ORF type:complete len:270 (+),score=94.71 TRINITY_DN43602_c0_g1_i1:51-812(+)